MEICLIAGTLFFSFASFLFGTIFGFSIFILSFPLIIVSIIISIIFIKKSFKEKKFHPASLVALIFIVCTFFGGFIENQKTKKKISEIKQIQEYVNKNYLQEFSELININDEDTDSYELIDRIIEEDVFFKQFPYGIQIEIENENVFRINYSDVWCLTNEDKVHLRPRP